MKINELLLTSCKTINQSLVLSSSLLLLSNLLYFFEDEILIN